MQVPYGSARSLRRRVALGSRNVSKRFDDQHLRHRGQAFGSMESSMPSSAGFTRRQVMTTSAALAVTALSIPTAAQAAARSTGSAAPASALDVVADMQPGWN